MDKMALHPTKEQELSVFSALEQEQDTADFIIPNSVDQHLEAFRQAGTQYLTLYHETEICGFIIYVVEDNLSIEFRRIVVSKKGKGIGTKALLAFETFCASTHKASRIWLDVFEDNARARHLYAKLGYSEFGMSEFNGQKLILMEKHLASALPD